MFNLDWFWNLFGGKKADDASEEPYWNSIERHQVQFLEKGKTRIMELPLDAKIVYDEEKAQWKFKLAGAKRWKVATKVSMFKEYLVE